jgi:hypothetical protein
MKTNFKFFPIFWDGEHKNAGSKTSWSKDDVSDIFNKTMARLEEFIPFTIDHPENNLPIIGWTNKDSIRLVERNGKRIIEAMPVEFSETSLDEVKNSGRKKVSVALRMPDFSIRHIGLVKNPAVVGLPAIPFSFDNSEPEVLMFELVGDQLDFVETYDDTDFITEINKFNNYIAEDIMPNQAELDALILEKKELQDKIKSLESDKQVVFAEKRALEFSSILKSDELKCKVVPALYPLALEFMKILDGKEDITFSEDGANVAIAPIELFKKFLSRLPDQITFKEIAKDGADPKPEIDYAEEVSDFNKITGN